MKQCYASIFLFFNFVVSLIAQQSPTTSFYSYNWQVINPAAIDNEFTIGASSKRGSGTSFANEGLSGTMVSATIRFNRVREDNQAALYSAFERSMNIRRKNFRVGVVLGVNKVLDVQNFLAKANCAYLISFGTNHSMNVGLNFGAGYHTYNLDDFRFRDSEAGLNPQSTIRTQSFNAAAGIFYTLHKFHLGISVPELVKKSALFTTLTANYTGNKLEPMITLRYVPKVSIYAFSSTLPVSGNFNIRYHIKEVAGKSTRLTGHEGIYFGLGYGTASVANLEVGKFISDYNYRKGAKRIGINFGIPIAAKNNLGRFVEFNYLRIW
jgi:Type IX secretion system membrane protein PorP/SprF